MSALQNLPSTTPPAPLRVVDPTLKPRAGLNPSWLLSDIVAGAVLVIWLWWRDTPNISGLGDWLTNAGRITGLEAGYSIVILLALMARVPALERGVGSDRLARWHSMGGRYTVSLVVAHGLLITWGYSITDHRSVFSETTTLWTQYADVLMASVAGLLLVGVGVASARAARKRLRYETWLYIHFYTYLATALAFSHQFSTGAQFVNDLTARIVWASMYIVVAALLIWFRFTMPLRQSLRSGLRVASVVAERDDVTTVIVGGKNLNRLQAHPGQFFRWRFLNKELWWTASPYSISAPTRDGHIRITAKHLGEHSRALANLKPGTRIIAEGPYGALTTARAKQTKTLLIAGGVGITPLRSLFESLSMERGNLVILIYRARNANEILFKDELDHIAEQYGSRVIYAVGSRDSDGDIVRPGVLQQHIANLGDCDAYLCGPSGMTTNAIAALRAAGVKQRHIYMEDFTF